MRSLPVAPTVDHRLVLPIDYDQLFGQRTVFITGISRSGTSILGKLVGSLEHALYLHEPILLRYIPPLVEMGELDAGLASQTLKGLLFEDYFLQVMHGRNLNLKREENSYFGNYEMFHEVRQRWTQFPRRSDVLKELRYGQRYTFVMKTGEVGPILPMLDRVFPGLRVIHIIRSGHEVISSSVRRGWYTDQYLNNDGSQWTQRAPVNIPWYVPEAYAERFVGWNVQTRVAYLWRTLVESIRAFGHNHAGYLELRYEDLMANPAAVLAQCEQFVGHTRTQLTMQHVQAIVEHQHTEHEDQSEYIDADEWPQFDQALQALGYH